MTHPSYGRKILAPLLKGVIENLETAPTSIFVLVDRRAKIALEPIKKSLGAIGLPTHVRQWWPSEQRKSFGETEALMQWMIRTGVDRGSLLIAAGGGITTDIGGFAASSILRGIKWGAIPTTLLGMADAAIGGKTAVNLPEGKNLAGAFHAPEFIICDISLLKSLAAREWNCGLGEIIKTGMVGHGELLSFLEETSASKIRRPGDAALRMAMEAGEVKLRIVEADPLERGIRKLLNLGHTFGHALETAAGPKNLAHGEAVGLGLLCALRMSEELSISEPGYRRRIHALMRRCCLPVNYPGALPPRGELTELLKRDKKSNAGKLDVILPRVPGECLVVHGVEPPVAAAVIHRELGD